MGGALLEGARAAFSGYAAVDARNTAKVTLCL
jgi:hypothetical protein